MKIGKKNLMADPPKMELLSQQTSATKISNFKRSRSFRASAKLMHKFRSHTGIRTAIGKLDSKSDIVSWRCEALDNIAELRYIPENKLTDRGKNVGATSAKETSDLRGIVREVKNKLSLNERTRRKNQSLEKSTAKERSNGTTTLFVDDRSDDNYGRNCRNNYWNSIDAHSYENPTFSLDGSLDSSVSECLYSGEPERDDFDKFQDYMDVGKSSKSTTCDGSWLEKKSAATMPRKLADYDCQRINCNGLIGEDKKIELDNLIEEEGEESNGRNRATADYRSGSWIVNRGANFRFGTAAGIKDKILQGNSAKLGKTAAGNFAGSLANAATSSSMLSRIYPIS